MAFQNEFDSYLAESLATLNEAAPDAFTPSLAPLDRLVNSISFAS